MIPLLNLPRWAWFTIAAVGIALALWLAIALIRRDAVHDDRAINNAQVGQASSAADAVANASDVARAIASERAHVENTGAITDAVKAHPEDAKRGVGPVTSSLVDRLRARQDADRAAGGK